MPDLQFTDGPGPRPMRTGRGSAQTVAAVPTEDIPVVGAEPDFVPVPIDDSRTILIHVVEDGFSAHGQIWYRGQEIEYDTSDAVYADTKDRSGNSWLDLDDGGQMRRYGRVYFRPGPWPGLKYDSDAALEAEQKRGRKPRPLAPVTGGRR